MADLSLFVKICNFVGLQPALFLQTPSLATTTSMTATSTLATISTQSVLMFSATGSITTSLLILSTTGTTGQRVLL